MRRPVLLLAALVLSCSAAPLAEAQRYGLSATWGSYGSGKSQFQYPWGIATTATGVVWVTDFSNGRVQRFTSKGRFIGVSSTGTADGHLDSHPTGVAVDAADNVYVLDDIVVKFSPDGRVITSWLPQQVNPHSIAVDRAGNVYVGSRDGIAKYTPTGGYITQWGETHGTGDGEFADQLAEPGGRSLGHEVATDPGGNVYAGDSYRVQKFTPDGRFIGQLGIGRLNRVSSVASDRGGNVYVGDQSGVHKFTATGRYVTRFGRPIRRDRFPHGPGGIAADAAGNIYITERDFVVEKFGPRPGKPRARTCRKPAARTRARRACFRFHSKQAGVRFQCRLTGRSVPKRLRRFRACTSPKRYRGLKPGRKAFLVRAIRSGVVGKPNQRRWRITR